MSVFEPYVAPDRLGALDRGETFPERQEGAALFADVCGFTAYGERLLSELGEREGAERVAAELSRIYATLLPVVEEHGGAVVGFNGDAVTCFFPGDGGRAATRAAHTMQARLSSGGGLPVKIAIAAGKVLRFSAGAPDVQRLDVLAGSTMDRMARAERYARDGEVVVASEVLEAAGEDAIVASIPAAGFAALRPLGERPPLDSRQAGPRPFLDAALARPFLLPPVYDRLVSGQGDFLAEFRRVTALFVGFDGVDYDHGERVVERMDALVTEVQAVLARRGGHLVKFTAGDKGSYLLGIFGAPVAQDDGIRQAVSAAMELAALDAANGLVHAVRVGVSHGRMLTGAFGTERRRAYDVVGTEANIAARLMQLAAPGEALVTPRVRDACPDFEFRDRGAVALKGRADPVTVFALVGRARAPRASERTATGSPAFLGRDAERARIAGRLRAFAERGHGGTIVVEGDVGIGKTRLLEDLREQAGALGLAVHVGAGDSIEQGTPYLAFRAPLASLLEAGDPEATEARAARLLEGSAERELLPLLSAVIPLATAENEKTAQMTGPARADGTAELVSALFLGARRSRRIVLVIEDTHWIDSASWSVLQHVRRRVPDLLVVISTRPPPRTDPDGRWETLAQFLRGREVERLHLGPLSAEDAVTLACSRLGVAALPGPVARLVSEKAGGHPLFSQELAVALRERGTLSVDGDRCRLKGDTDTLDAGELFDNVEEAITARVDGLRPGEQLALKVASVVGREFSVEDVRRVHPVAEDRARLEALLGVATEMGILGRRGPDGYAFLQAITQEVIYGLLPGAERRALHLGVGRLLEERPESDRGRRYPLLAHHFTRADVPEKAVRYLELAADQARRVYANREAVRHLGDALELGKRVPDVTRVLRARFLRQMGEALLDLGRLAEGRQRLRASAAELDRPAAETPRGLAASLGRGVWSQLLHRRFPSRFLGRDAHARAEILEAARVELGLAKVHFYLNEGPNLVDASLRAMNVAERAGPSPELSLAYSANAVVAGVIPLPAVAEMYGRLAVDTAESTGDPAALARVLVTVAVYDVGVGRWALARERVGRARALFEALGDRRQWEETLAVECPSVLHSGTLAEADALVNRLHASATAREDPHTLSWGLLGQVEVELRRADPSDLGAALARIEAVEGLFESNLGPMEELRAHGLGGLVRLGRGDTTGALASATRGLALAEKHRAASPHTLDGHAAIAATFLGLWEQRPSDATLRSRAKAACRALARYGAVFPIGKPRALIHEARFLRLSGHSGRAARTLDRALRTASELGMLHEAALARRERRP
ncbi:MAG TPA: adenylate/guanylate cyclase domain-containing protein [Polyangiaceae bacterium]|nr:adenylate/guanylate cyclase domain-containing protein [Polyangiaceae bacterium]